MVKRQYSLHFIVVVIMTASVVKTYSMSYSHWCPAIEMKRISCVKRSEAAETVRTNGPAILRRTYRWKKQFVLRCCPGFMGPNCQQACFSCQGFAKMTQRLNHIERVVQQVSLPENQRKRELLSDLTTPTYVKTQRHHVERLSHREQGVSSETADFNTDGKPYFVESEPDLVAVLNKPSDEHHTAGDPLLSDSRQDVTQPQQMVPNNGGLTSSRKPDIEIETKSKNWIQEQEFESSRPSDDVVTNIPKQSVENVWKHWDEEFQTRISTLERQVLELEAKVSALGPAMTDVTSMNEIFEQLSQRMAALEVYAEISGLIPQSTSDGNRKNKLKDGASSENKKRSRISSMTKPGKRTKVQRNRRTGKGERSKLTKQTSKMKRKGSYVKAQGKKRRANKRNTKVELPDGVGEEQETGKFYSSNTMKRSTPKEPIVESSTNLTFNNKKAHHAKPSTSTRRSATIVDSVKQNLQVTKNNELPDMTSSVSPSPCPDLCLGAKFSSRPPPPPLPDKRIIEKFFPDNSRLIEALGKGHEAFYRSLKDVLGKNITDYVNNTTVNANQKEHLPWKQLFLLFYYLDLRNNTNKLNETKIGQILSGDHPQSLGKRNESALNSGRLKENWTDFRLHRQSDNQDQSQNNLRDANSIGHVAGLYNGGCPHSCSLTFNSICLSLIYNVIKL